MGWIEAVQVVSTFIISVGGAGAIILAMSSYFGKIWSDKYIESVKSNYQKELEAYKNELDMIKETALRYSRQQFELYNKLWSSLYDLKLTADMLWEEANEQNLRKFSIQLKKTIDEVEKSCLFIEDMHYERLSKLLNAFKNYQIGKKELIQLYRDLNQERIIPTEIQQLVDDNRAKKKEYEDLMNSI